ncbi:RHS repeat protein, partial [Salmonella enterica]|nr:RHS repeat protein [Salmonella enterica]
GSGDGEAVQFPAALRAMLDRLEDELRRDAVSEESRAWLTQCGLTAEQMKNQLEPHPEPERKLHLYHCDHRGLPLALISPDNTVAWRAEYDEWGNLLGEENPEHLEQLIRLPGQQYDDESGLYYNRHRYYNPGQGRYITQDPIGLAGGWNLYQYPLNPVMNIDPKGLCLEDACIIEGGIIFSFLLGAGSTIQAQQSRQADNRPSTQEEARNEAESQKDQEYQKAKKFCDNKQPEPFRKRYENQCAFLSDKINHAQKCVDLYNDWDNKWFPGRHDEKITSWENRINNLKEEYEKACTDKSNEFN